MSDLNILCVIRYPDSLTQIYNSIIQINLKLIKKIEENNEIRLHWERLQLYISHLFMNNIKEEDFVTSVS